MRRRKRQAEPRRSHRRRNSTTSPFRRAGGDGAPASNRPRRRPPASAGAGAGRRGRRALPARDGRRAAAVAEPHDRASRRLPPAPAPRAVTDPDAEALAELSDLVAGDGPFDIANSVEFVEGAVAGLDRRLVRRLRAGDFAYQSHLDLHGMTADAGARRRRRFLTRAHRNGQRCVLIIHGRGLNSKDQVPVLKQRVTTWLARGSWARLVLAFTSARPCDGGAGALYVLLRRQRDAKRPIHVTAGREVVRVCRICRASRSRPVLPTTPRHRPTAHRLRAYGHGPMPAARSRCQQRLDAKADPPADAERLAPAAEIEPLARARAPPRAWRDRRSARRRRRRRETRAHPRAPAASSPRPRTPRSHALIAASPVAACV